MRIKDGFVLRKMPGMNLVMPSGKNIKVFHGALMLNETGAFIFERLQKGQDTEQIAQALTEEYDVTLEQARTDVQATFHSLEEAGAAEA